MVNELDSRENKVRKFIRKVRILETLTHILEKTIDSIIFVITSTEKGV